MSVVCDAEVVPFCERFGLVPAAGLAHRRHDVQSGAVDDGG